MWCHLFMYRQQVSQTVEEGEWERYDFTQRRRGWTRGSGHVDGFSEGQSSAGRFLLSECEARTVSRFDRGC